MSGSLCAAIPALGVARMTSGAGAGAAARGAAWWGPGAAEPPMLPAVRPGWTGGTPRDGVTAGRAAGLGRVGGAAGATCTRAAGAAGAAGGRGTGAIGGAAGAGAVRAGAPTADTGAGAAGRPPGGAAGARGAGTDGAAGATGRGSATAAPAPAPAIGRITPPCAAPLTADAAERPADAAKAAALGNPVACSAGAAANAPSDEMGMTPPQTEHRARTPVTGTRAGSTRNTERHSGQTMFTGSPRRPPTRSA